MRNLFFMLNFYLFFRLLFRWLRLFLLYYDFFFYLYDLFYNSSLVNLWNFKLITLDSYRLEELLFSLNRLRFKALFRALLCLCFSRFRNNIVLSTLTVLSDQRLSSSPQLILTRDSSIAWVAVRSSLRGNLRRRSSWWFLPPLRLLLLKLCFLKSLANSVSITAFEGWKRGELEEPLSLLWILPFFRFWDAFDCLPLLALSLISSRSPGERAGPIVLDLPRSGLLLVMPQICLFLGLISLPEGVVLVGATNWVLLAPPAFSLSESHWGRLSGALAAFALRLSQFWPKTLWSVL